MKKLMLLITICCIGCTVEPDMDLRTLKNAEIDNRFSVSRVGVFSDTLAYGERRGIYIIKDSISKKEYVGISGIGISELGLHSDGDDTIKDER